MALLLYPHTFEAMKMSKLYVICQLLGWATYISIAFILNQLSNVPAGPELTVSLWSAFVLGLLISHAYREIIIRNRWLELSISKMIPRFILGSLTMALAFQLFYSGLSFILFHNSKRIEFGLLVQEFAGWIVLFLLWSLIYFFYHFFKNYKQEEIKNLRWEAAINEMELNKLKSQLNPHFIFNAMNSIRALVDESPKKAKMGITQLSNILRSNLLMGRQKLIPFSDELKLVKDYLAIESYRYEERLKVEIHIDEQSSNFLVPPLMVQTIVENGIKHGIAHLPKGGTLSLKSMVVEGLVVIEVTNPGQYHEEKKAETGFGLVNTRERLRLLFGAPSSLTIKNLNKSEVITTIKFPLKFNDL